MREDERFAGECLVAHLRQAGHREVYIKEGNDPPDIIIEASGRSISVEVSQLSQRKIVNGRVEGPRAADDCYGHRILSRLNYELGSLCPNDVGATIFLNMPLEKPKVFEKKLNQKILEILHSGEFEQKLKIHIGKNSLYIHFQKNWNIEKKFVELISNMFSNPDINLNVEILLKDRIFDKSKKMQTHIRP